MPPPPGKIRQITSYFQKSNSASDEENLHEIVPTGSSPSTFHLQASEKSRSSSYGDL